MRTLRKQRDRSQQLAYFRGRIAMTEHRQSERGLGDEDITPNYLERRAGRVMHVLVVAGGDNPEATMRDRDLRRTQHMPRGMKRDRDIAQPYLLPIGNHLRRAREIIAVTQPHDVERFLRRQHRPVARTGMIGMTVSDDR